MLLKEVASKFQAFADWLQTPPGWLFAQQIYVLFAVFLLALVFNHYFGIFRKRGTKVMKPAERSKYVRELIEDIITDGVEDAVYAKKLTLEEASAWYKDLGESCKLPGLLAKATLNHRKMVKAGIKARLSNGFYKTKAPLPTPKFRSQLDALLNRAA